ncbi:Wzz/FepE/Etk N-terminal domain-containing protein [Paenilisteria weihenstephanensis]
MEETISLREIMEVLRKNLWIIIASMCLCAAATFGYLQFFL